MSSMTSEALFSPLFELAQFWLYRLSALALMGGVEDPSLLALMFC